MKIKFLLLMLVTFLWATGTAMAAPGAFDGPYPLNGVTPGIANWWATSVVGSSQHNNPDHILNAVDGSWAVGSPGGGFITVGFDVVITNGSGDDFAVWENGFWADFSPPGTVNPHSGVFAELGFVDVSTDGTHWATFPAEYGDTMTPFPNVDPTYVHNLAGNYVNDGTTQEGTPFDLEDILDTPAVLAGLVDPDEIHFVRLRDIIGAGEGGTQVDAFGNPVYDGNGYGGGADWDAVGVINTVPLPGAAWLLGSGLIAMFGLKRRRS